MKHSGSTTPRRGVYQYERPEGAWRRAAPSNGVRTLPAGWCPEALRRGDRGQPQPPALPEAVRAALLQQAFGRPGRTRHAAGDQAKAKQSSKPPSGCRSEAHQLKGPLVAPWPAYPAPMSTILFRLLDAWPARWGPAYIDLPAVSLTPLETANFQLLWPGVISSYGGCAGSKTIATAGEVASSNEGSSPPPVERCARLTR